jgi:hypothetical protein
VPSSGSVSNATTALEAIASTDALLAFPSAANPNTTATNAAVAKPPMIHALLRRDRMRSSSSWRAEAARNSC